MKSTFVFRTRVAFPDTDAMTVVHHSHYMDYCDEARQAWALSHGVDLRPLLVAKHFKVSHLKPAFFDDELEVRLKVQQSPQGFKFHYQIFRGEEKLTEAESEH